LLIGQSPIQIRTQQHGQNLLKASRDDEIDGRD